MARRGQFEAWCWLSLGLSSITLLFTSCAPPASFEPIRWEAGSGESPPEILKSAKFQNEDRSVTHGDFIVSRSLQRQNGFVVEGGFVKKIFDRSTGQLLKVLGQHQNLTDIPKPDQLAKLETKTFQLLERAKAKYPDLQRASEIFEPGWVLDETWNGTRKLLRVGYINKDQTKAQELDLTASGQIVAKRLVSHQFGNDPGDAGHGVGRVFPLTPLTSPLSDVVLENLIGGGTLSNAYLTVTSESQNTAFSKDLVFKYQPGDDRFDQVQAYYHMDRFLAHYRNEHKVNLPFSLTAKVHVGYPERKNAAFYYKGNIRIGSGDGKIYEHMPEDPSIVMHEAAHAIVDAFAGLPFKGQGGSINEGVADFLAANLIDSPRMAEASYLSGPYKRNLENDLRTSDQNGGLYHDSLILSGTLWEIRKQIGSMPAANFALRLLSHLGPSATFADVTEALQMTLEDESKPVQAQIAPVLSRRGWL